MKWEIFKVNHQVSFLEHHTQSQSRAHHNHSPQLRITGNCNALSLVSGRLVNRRYLDNHCKFRTSKTTTVFLSTRWSRSHRPHHNQSLDKPSRATRSYVNRARVIQAPSSEITSATFCRCPTPSAVLHRPPSSAVLCRHRPPSPPSCRLRLVAGWLSDSPETRRLGWIDSASQLVDRSNRFR